MFLFRLSLIILSFNAFSYSAFTDNQCLNEAFESNVEHKSGPFGINKVSLKVKKDLCVINVEFTRWFILKKAWQIDVCREPVHIKEASGSLIVHKKVDCGLEAAPNEEGQKYCQLKASLERIIKDEGLIYALGEKEDLSSDHGKIFCGFSLISKYLNESIIFNRHKKYSGVVVPKPDFDADFNENKSEDLPKEIPANSETMTDSNESSDGPIVREI